MEASKMQEYAEAYEALLEQTKEKCPDCKGRGFRRSTHVDYPEDDCFTCHGTGFVYHPERIVVLASDQNLPFSKYKLAKLPRGKALEEIGYLQAQDDMLKQGWRKVKLWK